MTTIRHETYPVEMVQVSPRRWVVRECGWDVAVRSKDRAGDVYRMLVAKHELMNQREQNINGERGVNPA